MKILFLVGFAIAVATSGCAGPRTASIGYRTTVPILITNMVGTASASSVGGQQPTLTTTTNWSIISTQPIPERTWREMALGQRPPGATTPLVIPPFPEGRSVVSGPPQRTSVRRALAYGNSRRAYSSRSDNGSAFSGRASLGQPNPRANLRRSPGSRTSLGQSNPRANLRR